SAAITLARDDAGARRLAALDTLHAHERLIREGWVFVVGTKEIDGERRKVCTPLLSQPVRVHESLFGLTAAPSGDREITPLVAHPGRAATLEAEAEFGGGALTDDSDERLLLRLPRLREWIREATNAADLHVDEVLPPGVDPLRYRSHEGL